MARPVSTVHSLPDSVREALHGWLRDPAVTQEEAAGLVNELLAEVAPGHPQVSRHVVSRYDKQFREVARELRESREIASMMIADLGSAPGGQMGHLVTEMIRRVSFRIMSSLQQSDLDADAVPALVKQLKDLSLVSQRVERASEISAKRERELQRQAAEDLAAQAEAEAGSGGAVTPERLRQIVREAYGV